MHQLALCDDMRVLEQQTTLDAASDANDVRWFEQVEQVDHVDCGKKKWRLAWQWYKNRAVHPSS